MAPVSGSLFKNLQPIGVGAGCGVEGAWVVFLYASAKGLLGCSGVVELGCFVLLRCESVVVGPGADSNRYTLVLTRMILVRDVGNPFWGIALLRTLRVV